ncbi:response regulator transcription factor [Motilimonas pumila]|uniref:Phosphate regulon transcriptional regulatory protein PhoB n=1 Tax=Motilimonas pumila TaxID=2303987 RepID=A0A418YDJ3_9GAMM|nr:response regulator transcription factor [Motilimonas pumila]RJG42606.1 DNA-binding response regulator [Motilimonas pumila]
MTDSVLVVEDDFDIAGLIKLHLQELALQVKHVSHGEQALAQLANNQYSLVILDLMLPDSSGLDICAQIRRQRPEQGILILTSRNSETDRVVGLELGADDYMCKPFSARELQARVRSLLRRVHLLQDQAQASAAELNEVLRMGALEVDKTKHRARYCQQALDLTATEFELLHFLTSKPDRVFSRSQLLEAVWGYQHECYEHTVNSHVNRLRNKLERNPAKPEIIQTVWGVGYKFNPAGVSA